MGIEVGLGAPKKGLKICLSWNTRKSEVGRQKVKKSGMLQREIFRSDEVAGNDKV